MRDKVYFDADVDLITNMSNKTYTVENRTFDKITSLGVCLYILFRSLSSFRVGEIGLLGNLLGFNTGLIIGSYIIGNLMGYQIKDSNFKTYQYSLFLIEVFLGLIFFIMVTEGYFLEILGAIFVLIFTIIGQVFIILSFFTVRLTLYPLKTHTELHVHYKVLIFNSKVLFDLPHESRLILSRATFNNRPDKTRVGFFYIEVRRPEGIVIHNIKLKNLYYKQIKEIETYFKEHTNFELSPKLRINSKTLKISSIIFVTVTIITAIILFIRY